MKRFRSVFFWTHLTAGALASMVILVMSFTGVVLALKPQIQDWIERDARYVIPQELPRLGAQQLLAAVKDARPEVFPQGLVVARDPEVAATVNLGPGGNVYVNPYTGAILGNGSARTTQFFQTMTTWHRYMGATGETRATGRSATGISNLAFLVLAVTGLYIWWPKQFTLQCLRPIVWFRRASTGRARDFNWHNTIGFWCLIPIVVMTVSGAVISYSWASNLVYRLTGSPVPVARGAGQAAVRPVPENSGGPAGSEQAGPGGAEASPRNGPAREGGAQPGDAPREASASPRGPAEGNRPEPAVIPVELDRIWTRAEQQVPTWSLLSMRLSNRQDGPVVFTITDGVHWNAFARSNLTLNGASGEVIQWQPYEASNAGQKLRGWLRFAHTGELGGLAGQVVAGLGCLGGVFLVCTGLLLAFRRLWNWSLWKRLVPARRPSFEVPSTAPASANVRETVME